MRPITKIDIITRTEKLDELKVAFAEIGVAGMTVTPDREKNVSFTQGYATATQVIIVRKD